MPASAKYEFRLMEYADEVLAARGVYSGLAADRRIDLGEEGRGYLDEAHASPDDAGGEAGEIADHSAAKGNDDVAAFEPGGQD